MLPTLAGRIQSRILFLATVGALVTLVMATILPASVTLPSGVVGGPQSVAVPLHLKYQDAYVVLFWVALFGVGWEFVYHLLMQWRWEKDWPTFFGLITFVNEGVLVYFLVRTAALPGIVGRGIGAGAGSVVLVPFWFFWIDLLAVWLAVWVWANGPMRVVNVHWRFFGGRIV